MLSQDRSVLSHITNLDYQVEQVRHHTIVFSLHGFAYELEVVWVL